jgi:hypothetical protein
MRKKVLFLVTMFMILSAADTTVVSAQSQVKVTRDRQIVDSFQGVDALYRPGASVIMEKYTGKHPIIFCMGKHRQWMADHFKKSQFRK